MIKSVLNKIANNIWLFISLTLGSLLITAILSSIPIYTDGALRKMLNTELTNFQEESGTSAGQFYSELLFRGDYTSNGIIRLADESREMLQDCFEDNGIVVTESYDTSYVRMMNTYGDGMNFTTRYRLMYMSGMEEHIKLLEGRMYSNTYDGVFEVMVSSQAYNSNIIHLGQEYSFTSPIVEKPEPPVITVRVVGVFEIDYEDGDYWIDADDGYELAFFASEQSYKSGVFSSRYGDLVTSIGYFNNIDFRNMDSDELNTFFSVYGSIYEYLDQFQTGRKDIVFPLRETITNYVEKGWQMELTLWVFNAPVIIMLAFYIFMVSRMIVEEDKNEISSLKSRGADPKQIFARYVLECGVIIGVSLIAGPPLGMSMAQMIGSANGFLEFINRSSMDLKLMPISYFYALIAGLLFMLMVLIPARSATRSTIVQHKQKKARKSNKPFWEKAFLDVILLFVSLFLLYIYNRNEEMLFDASGSVDPTIYFISTLFIIASGLLFLRIYPYILKLIFALSKRKMPPTVYATFVQVSRTGNDNRFLMMFLVLTVSIGIYSSASARIINNNVTEEAIYKSGAEVVLQLDWSDVQDETSPDNATETMRMPLNDYVSLDCFDKYTQVSTFLHSSVKSEYDLDYTENVRLMAIDPYSFSQVVPFRSTLLDQEADNPIHWYHYINLLQEYPTSVLVSRGIAETHNLRVGDTLTVDVNLFGTSESNRMPEMSCYILGILDFWPNYYDGAIRTDTVNEIVVMNRTYLTSVKSDTTYDLWFTLADGADKEDVIASLDEAGLTDTLTDIRFQSDFERRGKNDSMTMALNGSLSMGFVATMLISFLGFLLYWIMNVRKRKLQFGILRAMGLTRSKVTLMLAIEHLLTTGASVLVSILIGNLATGLFMPILSQTYKSLLPMELTYSLTDTVRILIIVAAMIIIGLIILAAFIRKLKINEAVKIGED